MEDTGFINSWKAFGQKLDSEARLDPLGQADSNFLRSRKELKKFLRWRFLETISFSICVLLLTRFVLNNHAGIHFVLAGVILGIFAFTGLLRSAWQMILILRIDYSGPVTGFQEQLEKAKIYNLQTLRLIFLSLPFYFAYIVIGFRILFGADIFSKVNESWLWINLVVSILFVYPSVWLYRNLSYKSRHRWLMGLIMDNGGKQLRDALQFLEDIEQFKSEEE